MQILKTGLISILLLMSTLCFGDSKIQGLVKEEKFAQIFKLIKFTPTLSNEEELPDNPKTNDLVIIENEYDVKILYEFFDGQWNEIDGKKIAQILQGDSKSTFHHLFNYKINAKEFNPYVSDNFKVSTETQSIKVKLLKVKFDEKAINKKISDFIAKNEISGDDIINIQILKEDDTCTVVISYRE